MTLLGEEIVAQEKQVMLQLGAQAAQHLAASTNKAMIYDSLKLYG